jgi:hypothetical protein
VAEGVRVESFVRRRLLVVMDGFVRYDFCGPVELGPGTVLSVGGVGGVELGDDGVGRLRPGPECVVELPVGSFHLEEEREAWDCRVVVERRWVGWM